MKINIKMIIHLSSKINKKNKIITQSKIRDKIKNKNNKIKNIKPIAFQIIHQRDKIIYLIYNKNKTAHSITLKDIFKYLNYKDKINQSTNHKAATGVHQTHKKINKTKTNKNR